nr:transposase [Micrococcus terreus]
MTTVRDYGRGTAEVAGVRGLAWGSVNTAVVDAALVLPEVGRGPLRALGIEERRIASAKWFKTPDIAVWCRVEPWMSTFVDAYTGHVPGFVDGRSCRNVTDWLRQRSGAWLESLEVVAIDLSATFRTAIRQMLPAVEISVNHWHMVKLGNQTLTAVRQRVICEVLGRRGRKQDVVWAHRMMLLCAVDRLTEAGLHWLEEVQDDGSFEESAAAWAVNDHMLRIQNAPSIDKAQNAGSASRWPSPPLS